jgi:hypothetical protein
MIVDRVLMAAVATLGAGSLALLFYVMVLGF